MTSCRLALPEHFAAAAFLDFHRRDAQAIAERVDGTTVTKGLIWHGRPACLVLRIGPRQVRAELTVDTRSTMARPAADELRRLVQRMLGLTQTVTEFEIRHAAHPQLGPLLSRQRGLRVPQSASPFEALAWAISGQQISVSAAISLRRQLILACGRRHSSGLWCHPDAAQVAALDEATLRQAGFSQSKAAALLGLSREVAAGRLPLDDWLEHLPVEEARQGLLDLRGIGPWTVNYALLRGYGWLDGSLHGDVVVRRKLQQLLGVLEPMEASATEAWLAQFSPWRALVAAHLWAMPAMDA